MKPNVCMFICSLLLLAPLYPLFSVETLETDPQAMPSATTASDWVLDQTLTVSNGAWLEDTVIVANHLYLLLSHNGNGTIGQSSWQTNASGWRIVKMTTLGNIDTSIEIGTGTEGQIYAQSNGVLARLSSGKNVHEFLEFDTSLSSGDRISINGSNSTGGDALLHLHASAAAGNTLVAMFSCSLPASGTASMLSQSCTDTNGNRRYITVKWDTSSNTTSIFSTSTWMRET